MDAKVLEYGPWYAVLSRVPELAREVGECVASGEKLHDIARRFGVSRGQLKLWLDGDEGRRRMYEAGLSALVDEKVMEALEVNDELVVLGDGVSEGEEGRVKLAMDGRDRFIKNAVMLAGKLDGRRFGDRVNVKVEMGLDVRVALEAARGRVGLTEGRVIDNVGDGGITEVPVREVHRGEI